MLSKVYEFYNRSLHHGRILINKIMRKVAYYSHHNKSFMRIGLFTASEKPLLNLNHNDLDRTDEFCLACSVSGSLDGLLSDDGLGKMGRPKKSF